MASNENPKTVLLSGDPVQYEAAAGGDVTPGMIVVYDADGEVEPGAAETFRIARERDFIGEGIDDEIPEGDNVPFYVARKGDRYFAWTSADISTGDKLEADANGVLIAADAGVTIAVALEDVDGTDNGPNRIRVEAI